jgi:hypothetical protein
VTASAPGYATQTESLVFDGDRTITLSLEPSARPRARPKPQAGDPDLGF